MKTLFAKKIFFISFFISNMACAQLTQPLTYSNDILIKELDVLRKNDKISPDSAWTILSNWNKYPDIKETGRNYLFLYEDSIFGTVPLKIFIPKNYRNDIASPAVLILHGAVVLSSFKDAYKDTASDEDIFFSFFEKENFIIIRPFADTYGPNSDGTKLFGWVANSFNGRANKKKTNPTFSSLCSIIMTLKKSLNINDNKVFAFGHSDGSDGAFALQVYKPSLFAGFIAYNSILTNLFANDIFLTNTVNRPLYLVHSELDDLRPIQQARDIVRLLDSLKSEVVYKEYMGYKHYDQHLQIDLPYSYQWTKQISRNPFHRDIYWELSDMSYNICDWIRIVAIDTTYIDATWHKEVNTLRYNKRTKTYDTEPYYSHNESAAVKAFYNNNKFKLTTSRTKEVEILISPIMVNLQNSVIVEVNGKEVFNKLLTANKFFLLDNFAKSYDRQMLWLTSVKIKIE
jgi:predicted esterase